MFPDECNCEENFYKRLIITFYLLTTLFVRLYCLLSNAKKLNLYSNELVHNIVAPIITIETSFLSEDLENE